MLTKNEGDKFYYLHRHIEGEQVFLAVVGLKLEKRRDVNNQIQVNTIFWFSTFGYIFIYEH